MASPGRQTSVEAPAGRAQTCLEQMSRMILQAIVSLYAFLFCFGLGGAATGFLTTGVCALRFFVRSLLLTPLGFPRTAVDESAGPRAGRRPRQTPIKVLAPWARGPVERVAAGLAGGVEILATQVIGVTFGAVATMYVILYSSGARNTAQRFFQLAVYPFDMVGWLVRSRRRRSGSNEDADHGDNDSDHDDDDDGAIRADPNGSASILRVAGDGFPVPWSDAETVVFRGAHLDDGTPEPGVSSHDASTVTHLREEPRDVSPCSTPSPRGSPLPLPNYMVHGSVTPRRRRSTTTATAPSLDRLINSTPNVQRRRAQAQQHMQQRQQHQQQHEEGFVPREDSFAELYASHAATLMERRTQHLKRERREREGRERLRQAADADGPVGSWCSWVSSEEAQRHVRGWQADLEKAAGIVTARLWAA
ncbi:hypothetical protein VTJ83DRAFT_4760 [Remersonia thermophila]|uniref:Uncharacterized protein n=1 Tax=Remersonia thermophila TaxID=72144 RepID=A0ABR4DAX1_9PEZI